MVKLRTSLFAERFDKGLVFGYLLLYLIAMIKVIGQSSINIRQRKIVLGRYFVGEAGVYVTRVVDRKVSRGQIFLVCDGGLNHHLSASGNFGQVVRKNYPVSIGNRVDAPREVASAVGPLV